MYRTTLVALPTLLMVLAACGRVPDDRVAADLDEKDVEKLCEEFVDAYPQQTFTCESEGVTIDIEVGFDLTLEQCIADFEPPPEGCTATVGDLRTCYDALFTATEEEICDPDPQDPDPDEPGPCDALFTPECSEDAG